MRRPNPIAVAIAVLLPCAIPARAQTVADSGTFVIRHGDTTVATEDFSRTATALAGTLHLRNSRNTFQRYNLVVAPDATVPMVEVTVREDADSGRQKARLVQRSRVIFRADSAAVDAVIGQRVETLVLGTTAGAVPYLNMSFAMLEQAVRRSRAPGGKSEVPFFNLGGGQTLSGKISPLAGDSLNLAIGDVDFHLAVDNSGRVLGGRIPSQDVVVERLGSP
ncbi:MAG TPA: hypothetical protein VEB59_17240 [Gemmatimonadales bacterium]|nr:hypothetical protein [Gemmatimonadales bacterium]